MADPWKRREVIGGQTLLLGDAKVIVPALGAIEVLITDPPYGMAFCSKRRTVRHKAIANDGDDTLLQWACSRAPLHSAYIFARWDNLRSLPKPQSLVTWVKNNWSMGNLNGEHARQTEVCLFYRGPQHFFPNGRPSDVISRPRTGNKYHPTEKPVSLLEEVCRWTDGTVLDAFMGSGTTLVACQRLGRNGIGIEIDEGYFDIACRRVEAEARAPRLDLPEPVQPKQESLL